MVGVGADWAYAEKLSAESAIKVKQARRESLRLIVASNFLSRPMNEPSEEQIDSERVSKFLYIFRDPRDFPVPQSIPHTEDDSAVSTRQAPPAIQLRILP